MNFTTQVVKMNNYRRSPFFLFVSEIMCVVLEDKAKTDIFQFLKSLGWELQVEKVSQNVIEASYTAVH